MTATQHLRHFILGTAGHVDHGKTELVKALTGHDTDRLKEEKERGISIELGFAPLPLAPDVFIGVVDVPGHERFVRRMVAGAGGIDLAMLLVAADEGVMPQTEEHLEVLRSLGIRHGVVVISKADLATVETLTMVREEIAKLVRGSFLESAPVVPVSARTGVGLAALREQLLALAREISERDAGGDFRLAVDRVFVQKGIGVVVTGSCYSGRVRVGDELVLLPANHAVRVREVQSFSEKRNEGVAGERLAIALHGVKRDDVLRGDMLTTPDRFAASRLFDVRISLSPGTAKPLRNRERVRIHHGAREVLGSMVLLDADEVVPGASAIAQVRLETPLVAAEGDRFVLRRYSPACVIGGGVVVDASPGVHKRFDEAALEHFRHREQGDPMDLLARAIMGAGATGMPRSQVDHALAEHLAARGDIVLAGAIWFHAAALDGIAARAIEIASAHESRHVLQWGIDREELRRRLEFPHAAPVFQRVLEILVKAHPLFVREDRVRAGSPEPRVPPELAKALSALNDRIRQAGLAFLLRDEAQRAWSRPEPFADAAQWFRNTGEWIDIGDEGWMHREAFDQAVEALRGILERSPAISVADVKECLKITRKHAIPLLECFDRKRLTIRRGDSRVAGPGLAKPQTGPSTPQNFSVDY
ncbi:MAG TPA: selenocysteine-specific translation elongation factor [Candidatus Krumholzibacteria bacterium]|nr:selenocysteine-specific translation elongation factor [Candidatus Krumholzibacteria bacterium]